MIAVLWLLGALAYLVIGGAIARLRVWQVFRSGRPFVTADLQAEMLALMLLWPLLVPCYLLAMAIRRVLFPRRLR